jgi:hypothetical protein
MTAATCAWKIRPLRDRRYDERSADLLRKGKYGPMKSRSSQTREAAESLAIQALAFLADDPERFADFLATTGLTPERLRESASHPHFLIGVLEHMLAHESLLIAFADSAATDPAEIARAHDTLGGRRDYDLP